MGRKSTNVFDKYHSKQIVREIDAGSSYQKQADIYRVEVEAIVLVVEQAKKIQHVDKIKVLPGFSKISDRSAKMLDAVINGSRLTIIGKQYNISATRVRQIVFKVTRSIRSYQVFKNELLGSKYIPGYLGEITIASIRQNGKRWLRALDSYQQRHDDSLDTPELFYENSPTILAPLITSSNVLQFQHWISTFLLEVRNHE